MKTSRQDFILGIVVLAFLALFVGTVMFVYPSLHGEMRTIEVRFRHDLGVAPLKVGSPVMLSGALEVGKVVEVGMINAPINTPAGKQEHLLIAVKAEIDANLALYADCQIASDQPPVGGGGVLVILDVGSPPELAPDVIEGLPPQSFAAAIGNLSRRLLGPGGLVERLELMLDMDAEGSLAAKLATSLDDINDITARMSQQLDPQEQATLMAKFHLIVDQIGGISTSLRTEMNAGDQDALLARIHVVLNQIAQGLGEANAMLTESRPLLHSTLTSVESATKKIDEDVLAAFQAELNPSDPDSLMGKIHLGMDQLNASLDNLTVITQTGRKLIVLNRPALQKTIENLKAVSDQMKIGVQEIVLAPWRLLKPPGEEIRKLDVFDAARRFAEAATVLDDAAARLEALQTASAEGEVLASPEELQEIRDRLDAAFERFNQAETYLWQEMK